MAKARKTKSQAAKAKAKAKKVAPKAKPKKKAAPSVGKKKTPASTVKRGRPSKPTKVRAVVSTPPKLPEFPGVVKRKAPPVRAKPAPKRKPKLSRHPDAVRARKYRAERRAVAEALAAEREQRLAARRERAKARRAAGKRPPPSEAELAVGWLERIRDDAAEIAPTSLELVGHNPGDPNLWIRVGRFDFFEGQDYETMGAVLEHLSNDIELEAMIHPMRLSQIRIGYHDPNARHRESDGTISSIGPWSFILGELTGEIAGGGAEDENALAVRYDQSVISEWWVYFSSDIRNYQTVVPGQRTATIPLNN
jgi:hypothetical protein